MSEPPPITIRSATEADVDGLARVYIDSGRHHAAIDPVLHQVPSEAAARERIRAKLADPGEVVFVAETTDGQVVGLLQVDEVHDPRPGVIVRPIPSRSVGIAVREDWRNRGVGEALMRHAEIVARDLGADQIILDMSSANDDALRFYGRLGYVTYGLLLRKSLTGREP